MEHMFRIEDIDIRSLIKDILKNLWVIILITMSASMAFSAYTKLAYVPEYTSDATMVISLKGSSGAYSSLETTSELAQVFAEVFRSNVLRDTVASELGLKTLEGSITANVIPQTNLMKVSAVSSSPEQAFRTLSLVLENYSAVSDYLFNNAILEVIKEPEIPTYPSNSFSAGQYKSLVTMAGFCIGLAAVAALSIMRDTVQTTQGARHKLDGHLLGTIVHEVKNKTRRLFRKKKNSAVLITNPLASFQFVEAYQSLCSKIDYQMRHNNQKILLVCSASENEGKSTVAANLALAMANRRKKVLLIDCDFRKPALYKIFEMKLRPSEDFGTYLGKPVEDADEAFVTQKRGIEIVANHNSFRSSQKLIMSEKMKRFLEEQKKSKDCIIIDSPPMMVATDAEALAQIADVSLLVVRQDGTSVSDINDCMDNLRQAPADFAGYVLNNFYDGSAYKKKSYHKEWK